MVDVAWDVSERARRERGTRPETGPVVDPQWRGPDASVEPPSAPLDDLINEHSAETVEALEEQERERAAALAAAVATAPLRVASASGRRLGSAMHTLFVGGAGAIGGALRSTGLAAGTGLGAVRRRRALGRLTPVSPHPVRRSGRRLGAAAVLALAVAAPAAAVPAPWGALVGFSVDGTGARPSTSRLPGDLATANAFGPLPVLPERGLTEPGLAGVPVGLDSGANPAAAGLPIGGGDLSIPSTVLLAYQQAADRLAATSPGCQLTWPLLAGIGKVESNHARGWSGTAGLTADGTATPTILGPLLDGSTPGTAVLPDTDGGRLDGNASFDRAVGPMQFVPATWKLVGQDGNGDGKADPNNVFDAALSTGSYLCAGGRDLGVPATELAAVLAYNPSPEYARTVLAWASAYGSGRPVDLSTPAFAGPPAITGDSLSGFPVPVSGTPVMPYADAEGGNGPGAPMTTPTDPSAGGSAGAGTAAGQAGNNGTTNGNGGNPAGKPPKGPGQPGTNQPGTGQPGTNQPGTGTNQPGTNQPGTGPTTPPTQTTPADLTVTRTAITEAEVTDPNTNRVGLHFTITVTASKASSALIRLRLADTDNLRVTGIGKVVPLVAGPNTVTLDVDGGFLGDSGVDGPYRVTTTYRATDSDGNPADGAVTEPLGAETRTGTYHAADFAYYVPSIARIDGRVSEFHDRGLVTAAAQTRLHALLVQGNAALGAVRAELAADKADGSVGNEAYVRLLSLVQRHQNPPPGKQPTPESTATAAPPGRDPEVAAGRPVS